MNTGESFSFMVHGHCIIKSLLVRWDAILLVTGLLHENVLDDSLFVSSSSGRKFVGKDNPRNPRAFIPH